MIKCIVKTANGLVVECELKTKNFVFVKKLMGGRK